MLKPEEISNSSDTMIKLYQNLEDWILNDIAERLLESEDISGTTDRELWKLQQMGMHQTELKKKIKSLTGFSDKELKEILEDAVLTSWEDDAKTLKKGGIKASNPLKNKTVMKTLEAEFKKTKGELSNLTQTTMIDSSNQLITMLNDVDVRVSSGMQSQSQAICDIIDQFAKTGLQVSYPSGTTRQLESAVRCAVQTSVNQTTAQVTNDYIAEEGIEYVLVSAHLGARHSKKGNPIGNHDEWQGKAYKIEGSEDGFPNLTEATGYRITKDGTGIVENPIGLHGYNCRHSHQPWFKDLENPWIDKDGKPKVDMQESQKRYAEEQAQRQQERTLREYQRRLQAKQLEINHAKGIDRDNLQNEYDALAKKWKDKTDAYKEFSEKHNLPMQNDRIRTAGFRGEKIKEAKKRAKIWEKQEKSLDSIKAKSYNYGDFVKYDKDASFRIEDGIFPKETQNVIQESLRRVAILGGNSKYEYGQLINLDDNSVSDVFTSKDMSEVDVDWDYLDAHAENRFAFVHNHNFETTISLPDMQIMTSTKNIDFVVATSNNGIVSYVESNGNKTKDYLYLHDDYSSTRYKYINEHKDTMSSTELTINSENELVQKASKEFGKGLKIIDGRVGK